MKSIKFFIYIFFLVITISINSQVSNWCYGPFTVDGKSYTICALYNQSNSEKTPFGNPVQVLLWLSDDWTPTQKNELLNGYKKMYSGLTFESEATAKYNCHSWAWAGGTTFWMNQPNQSAYWNDSSFIETTSPPPGAIVRYNSSDHSAVVINSSTFSSKWAAGPRFTHPINQSPYSSARFTYYVRKPVSFSGSSTICVGSPATFSASYTPYGFSWDKSSNLTLSSTSSSTITVTAISAGSSWISIKNKTGVEEGRFNIWVGPPVVQSYIDGPSVVQNSQINTFSIYGMDNSFTYSWSATGGNYGVSSNYYSGNTNYANMYFSPAGSRTIQVAVSNACGSCSPIYKSITVTQGGDDTLKSAVYPNPTTDIIRISIDKKEQSLFKSSQPVFNYDIRLFDGRGILRRQTKTQEKTVQFNVSDLPNGIYFIHIYDGVSQTPEVQKVIVSH